MEQNLTLISAVPVEIDENISFEVENKVYLPLSFYCIKKTGQKRRKDDMNWACISLIIVIFYRSMTHIIYIIFIVSIKPLYHFHWWYFILNKVYKITQFEKYLSLNKKQLAVAYIHWSSKGEPDTVYNRINKRGITGVVLK